MPQQARLDTPGALHHIIIRGIEKRKIVDDRMDRKEFVSRLEAVATETKTLIYAWSHTGRKIAQVHIVKNVPQIPSWRQDR